jgi:hypothetical protein
MEKAAIRSLGANTWSAGHTEIAVLGQYENEAVEIAGVLFFKATPEIEKKRLLDFAHKYSLPSVEIDQLQMNPTIEKLPLTGNGTAVQDLPIDWE